MHSSRAADKTLEQEQLEVIAQQVKRVSLPIFLAMALIAQFASQYQPPEVYLSWLLCAALILVLRSYLLPRAAQWSLEGKKHQLATFIALAALQGIIHGGSCWFFPQFTVLEQVTQSLILLAIGAGAVATTAGHRTILMAYLLPSFVPTSIMWALSIQPENEGASLLIGILILLFGAVLLGLARDLGNTFKNSFTIRLEQRELNQKLQASLAKTEAANLAKTRFLAAASHDLRQPIHTLSLFCAALETQRLDKDSEEIVGHMHTALDSLANQLDALLDISKLDANIIDVKLNRFNCVALAHRLQHELCPVAQEKGLQCVLKSPEQAWVHCDETLLERTLRNLLSNAIKYTHQGVIELRITEADDSVFVDIIDSGCGIDLAEHEKIFEEFYQIDNPERDRSQGLGLGLAIVLRLCALMKVPLDLESRPDEGSRFRLQLEKSSVQTAAAKSQAVEQVNWQGLKILVIDDEVEIGLATKALLSNWGCQVQFCESRDKAMELAQHQTPDIVLSDLRLRGEESGIRAVEQLRELHPELPALLISGDIAADRLLQAKTAGLELLHKPVKAEQLQQAIAKACGLAATKPSSTPLNT